ncbi:MAG: hypothetical protein HON77_00935 [Gammaproteobacteria bacterium]|jgi:hypothetical protein|nr:hypothetical protein [Gammaproteobacteria bacterium]
MNWETIGAISELVGSITVIVTVIYLAVQIKQSSKTAVTDVIGSISSNTEAVKTYTEGLRGLGRSTS